MATNPSANCRSCRYYDDHKLNGAAAQVKELRIGYQPSPIQDASIAMFETWGAKKGIKIVKVPNSYGVYVEKMTASLTSNSDQYDVIWHNDDWGQLWEKWLEPTDDVARAARRKTDHHPQRLRRKRLRLNDQRDGENCEQRKKSGHDWYSPTRILAQNARRVSPHDSAW